jgi:ketosteroid isomerase-like protein
VSEHPNVAAVRSAYEAVGRGDVAAFGAALADDVLWYESTPGFEGEYRGRDAAVEMLGRVFAETGMEVVDLSIRHILADDDYAVVLIDVTMALGDRQRTGEYVDVYRLRDGLVTEHRHLPVDPNAEAEFFGTTTPRGAT